MEPDPVAPSQIRLRLHVFHPLRLRFWLLISITRCLRHRCSSRRRRRRLLLSSDFLDIDPRHQQGADDGRGTDCHADIQPVPQRQVVNLEHGMQTSRGDDVPEIRGTDMRDEVVVDARDGGEAGGEFVEEDVVGDADADGAAEALGEEHDCGAGGDVLAGEDRLGRD